MLVPACEQHKGRTDDRGGEERLLRGAGTPDVKTNHSVGLERECRSLQGQSKREGRFIMAKDVYVKERVRIARRQCREDLGKKNIFFPSSVG